MKDKTMDTYKRTGLVFVGGKGSVLETEEGKQYLDFASGIGVNSLGHGYPKLAAAIAEQASRLIHVSNYYQSRVAIALSDELCARTGMDAVFLCNSGAEANEGAIKIARKFGNEHGGRHEILTFENSFHGRTLAGISATGQVKVKHGFEPPVEGFRHVPFNDLDAVANAVLQEAHAGSVMASYNEIDGVP